MNPLQPSRTWNWPWLLAWSVGASVVVILFQFNPATHGFYPRCLFHQLTGLNCPGCGGLRAVHQLLHGQLVAALRLNALVVLALPGLLWWLAYFLRLRNHQSAPPRCVAKRAHFWLLLALLAGFAILRNVPAVQEFVSASTPFN
jgi:hypothetical protein